jgi:hypothetical protein
MATTDRPDITDLGAMLDEHLHTWLNILDRRMIQQVDEPVHTDVVSYMAVWNEIARRNGDPPCTMPFTAHMAPIPDERE